MKYKKSYDEKSEDAGIQSSKQPRSSKKSSLPEKITANKINNNDYIQQQLLGNLHVNGQSNVNYSSIEKSLIDKLKIECYVSGKEVLWLQFEKLTKGQQQAFLADIYKLSKESYELPKKHDWAIWEKHFSRLSQMPLEDEEAYREVRDHEQLDVQSFFEIKVEQFLSPYREIVLWLNYKGNHQNKVNILQRFEQLPIDRKKWLIQKLLNGKKINAQSFVSELTVTVREQASVDWEKIVACLDEQESKSEKAITEELQQFEEMDVQPEAKKEDGDFPEKDNRAFLLLGLFSGDDNKEEKETPEYINLLQEWCKSADQLSMLLFSKGLLDDKQPVEGIDMLTFVDRMFMISTSSKEKVRREKRESMLKKNGFVSAVSFANYGIDKIAKTLYEKGIVQRDAKYKKIIDRMGFPKDNLPSQEQLLKKLYLLYLG